MVPCLYRHLSVVRGHGEGFLALRVGYIFTHHFFLNIYAEFATNFWNILPKSDRYFLGTKALVYSLFFYTYHGTLVIWKRLLKIPI